MAFEGFDPIFSKPKVEWTSRMLSCSYVLEFIVTFVVLSEQEHSARTNMLAAEKERNESIQLEQRQKFQKIRDLDNGVSTKGLQNSPDKQATRHGGSTKVKNRKVPAYRRTKVRGALLHDNEE
ncbi:uncharacterized protein LOC124836875 [Vigna umbellata]|uniref:uncharacterized protein LOC124836875 n=1 Tax=Vigna umbellata TaxID=87088 RepID=UPI001F5EC92E|nr:uncharacterized protein LOC124836875 [Vigna umbellata]